MLLQHLQDPEFVRLSLPFLGYFGVLVPALVVCMRSSVGHLIANRSKSLPTLLLGILLLTIATLSLTGTWFYIITWIVGDAQMYLESHPGTAITAWMKDCDLFTGAYVLVTEMSENWWWSVKLLNFVPSMVVFMWASAASSGSSTTNRVSIPAAGFLILGMLGAISVCWPLFLIQHVSQGKGCRLEGGQASFLLSICMALSVLSNVVQPYLAPGSVGFDFNLKAIHVLLLAPLLFKGANNKSGKTSKKTGGSSTSDSVRLLLIFLAGCSFVSFSTLTLDQLHAHAFDLARTLSNLQSAFFSNACQSSITLDYFSATTTSVLFMLYEVMAGEGGKKLGVWGKLCMSGVALLAPVLSTGVVFPLFLALIG
ncbi:hypothetical protein BJ741DRAFT_592515 [Chytriomyces cf. hyalinus JEL632]|nr:hypothetical protein BJ741DRAFT_592515 [Chytriomyces cf. hyalinus JEL632]